MAPDLSIQGHKKPFENILRNRENIGNQAIPVLSSIGLWREGVENQPPL